MGILGAICIFIGIIMAIIFGFQLLILAFKNSIWWGLGFLFVPMVNFIFVFTHWNEAKTPFLRLLLSIPCFVIGGLLMPAQNSYQ